MDVWLIYLTINQPLVEVSGIWNIPCSLNYISEMWLKWEEWERLFGVWIPVL